MNEPLPRVCLVRHGETAWSLSGRHTGRTDLPLTAQGEANARGVGERLIGVPFACVLTSPLTRARRTCDLAGFGTRAVVDSDLLEWDYGAYRERHAPRFAVSGRDGRSSTTAAPVASR